MKIHRSTKLSLKNATAFKKSQLNEILDEYACVTNAFIDLFWKDCPSKSKLLKPVVDSVDSWFSARLRKVAAREAIDMIKASQNKKKGKVVKPIHKGKRMYVSSTIADLQSAKGAEEFDAWLHLSSIGQNNIIDIPVRFHRHFNLLYARGKRLESYVITRNYVQLTFEIETGEKKPVRSAVGVDTGIKALASLSSGEQFGLDIENCIHRVFRCKQGSKGQKKASRALKQRIDEIAKEVVSSADLIVVENLKGITQNTKLKRRLNKNMRRVVSRWGVRYWLSRLQAQTEDHRVTFRSVPAYNTSVPCSSCGHVDKSNRSGEKFSCRQCGSICNADINAGKNILDRLLSGPYGAGFKASLCT